MTDTADAASNEPSTIPDLLLALQAVDTQADQLAHRRERSPLRDDLASATDAMRSWESERASMRARIDELGASIEQAEERGAELSTHRRRLEAQMKTVIAPREAEALMHEMDTLGGQIDELDLHELESLEEQARVDDQLAAHLRGEEQFRARLRQADDALAAEVGVAVARLVGKQCQGCHLELSAAEIDTAKDEAADTGVTDCPDCGRLLIV